MKGNIGIDRYLGHATILDAHTKNPFELLRTGEYLWPAPILAAGDQALVGNKLYAIQCPVVRAMTLDRLAAWVKVASGIAGSVARLGIYNNGTNLYPGTLALDAGTIATDSIGIKAITINKSLTKGLYWLALLADTDFSIRYVGFTFSLLGAHPTDLTSGLASWDVAQTYGALPDPFTAGGTCYNRIPLLICPRILSLD